MNQCYVLTQKNIDKFTPLLPPDIDKELRTNKATFAIGAECFGVAGGILVAEMVDDIINIRYISVNKHIRRMGVATNMVHFLEEYAEEEGACIICDFIAKDQDTPIYTFFNELGNYSIEKQMGKRISAGFEQMMVTLEKLPNTKKDVKSLSYFATQKEVRSRFYERLKATNMLYVDLFDNDYDQDLSRCYLDKDDASKIGSVILVKKNVDENNHINLELSYAWCSDGEEVFLILLMRDILSKVKDLGTEDICLHISAVNASSEGLVDKLLIDKTVDGYYFRAAWDMEV